MLEKTKRTQRYYEAEYIIKECRVIQGIKGEPTAEEVLSYLLGDQDGWNGSDYFLYRYDDIKAKTFIQRLNTLWVYPLFIATIPLQYLFRGKHGLNRNSRLGKVVFRLVGCP